MGTPFKGVLFAGLMITDSGPKLIEYNARFGDPECQVLMLRLKSDLVPALLAARDGVLKNFDLRWYPDAALTVVMAAKGYPGAYGKGSVIEGLDEAAQVEGVEIFHAGTRREGGTIRRQWRPRARMSAPPARRWPKRSAGPMPRSTRSTGRTASAAAISASGRWRVR